MTIVDAVTRLEAERKFKAEQRQILKVLGDNLCRAREAAEHSQESLALACSVSRTDVGAIERGKREPGVLTLLILADALGLTLNDLMAGVPVPKKRRPATHTGPARKNSTPTKPPKQT